MCMCEAGILPAYGYAPAGMDRLEAHATTID